VYFEVAFIAYVIDRIFGEFKAVRHPVVLMGEYINWFEKSFYQNSIYRGALLTISLICIVGSIAYILQAALLSTQGIISYIFSGIVASTTIASKMLYDSVGEIIEHPHKIGYLVSRDTASLSSSDINKAAIETYAENLSDGVVAPLFYLLLFGLWGAFVYKAVNTLDSMVGYRDERYEKFGKVSARLDDLANLIPSRITGLLILLLMGVWSFRDIIKVLRSGKLHESPNAGYPISAMAFSLGIKLGGDTSYFGKIKSKPFFGEGRERIERSDIKKALTLQPKLDIFIIIFLAIGALL